MNRHRPTLLLVILASLVVLLAACSSESSATAEPTAESTPTAEAETEEPTAEPEEEPAADAEVRIVNAVFQPGELTVSVGDEVAFINDDTFTHTITEGTDGDAVEDPIVDEEITGRGEVRVTFDEAGTYDITCEIHPTMQVTITVGG